MRSLVSLVATTLVFASGSALLWTLSALQPAQSVAVELSDGSVSFVGVPLLTQAYATRTGVAGSNATYYLTLDLPADADEPLQTLTVRLTEGRRDPMFFFLPDETFAFEGTPNHRGEALPIGSVEQDAEAKVITVQFEPAIAPGRSLTLALRPVRNPRFSGVYLFEVTAAPQGEKVRSQFAGYARLSFYDRSDDPFFRLR